MHGGTIQGKLTDRSHRTPLVGADVSLRGTKTGTVTDTNGCYVIHDVPEGEYALHFSIVGYKPKDVSVEMPPDSSGPVTLDAALEEQPVDMAEVVVQGRADKELETSARLTEKESNNIVNVIAAQTIERSTDRTAADVLQRVSGMSLVRSQGEGKYVVMRGLEQRYNNTVLDGIKIPSPESKDRFVPLDIFPSALFERIEVTKALTPDIAGDAIGGSTNLLLREAPDHPIFSFSAAGGGTSGVLGSTYSSFDPSTVPEMDPDRLHGAVSDADPTTQLAPRYQPTPADFAVSNLKFTDRKSPPDGLYSMILGDRILGERLGIVAAGSYQNTFTHVPTDFYSVDANINRVDAEGHLIPYPSQYTNQQYFSHKLRGGAMVKGDFIADIDHQISATYMYVRQEEDQTRHETQITIDGTRGAADLTYSHRTALRTQTISSVSVGGSHFTTSPFEVRWTANYTDAVQDRPDEAEYSLYQNYDPYGHLQPFLGLADITHVWRRNDDTQKLGKIDATFHVTDDGAHTIQFGILAQKLNRVNFQNDYKLNPAILNGRTQVFTTIDSTRTSVFGYGSTSGTSVYGYQNYKADETLGGAYLEYTLLWGNLETLAGVRWEEARDTYFTMAPISVGENQAKVTTVDFLPGIHFRYAFSEEHIGRFSVTQTMSRPSYFDLVPASDRSDASQTQGNPNLRPAHSVNIDLRYEYYPNARDMFSLGCYYKRITDPIEDQFNSVGVVLVTTKANGAPATVRGVEAVIAKYLGDFGVSANYSHVWSAISNGKKVPTFDRFGDPINPAPWYTQTRPLQAQSPDIFNLSLIFQDHDWGTGLNLSYNYTGRRLIAVGLIDGYDTYQDGLGELDFSGEQVLFVNLRLFVKLINLTNATAVTEIASGEYIKHDPIVIQREFNKFRGSVGLSFTL